MVGFRCFPLGGATIHLDQFVALVGANGAGKTGMMVALLRLFGEGQFERTLRATDFHLEAGEKLSAKKIRELSIEATLAFPEFDSNPPTGVAIPEFFNQMLVANPGGTPYCRLRLEGTWTADGSQSGEVDQKLWWITTPSDDAAVVKANKRLAKPEERARIRMVYVSAARDGEAQLQAKNGLSYSRLVEAVDWAGQDEGLRTQLKELRAKLKALPAVTAINTAIQERWQGLYDGAIASHVELQSVDAEPATLLEELVPTFSPGVDARVLAASELSEGLRSLLAITLPLGAFRLERDLRTKASELGFVASASKFAPTLSIVAVEEPENHLAPHYLGKVIAELKALSTLGGQVLVSSHSPSILSRVEPDSVRFFLGGERRPSSEIRSLVLPKDDADESFKYVREAVRSHPELYFSRVVVLGEGPSEEIVLRALFEQAGTPLDASFISIVPLGGRHVNHFWRLMNGLGIPFVTLLDLDREKEGAGWDRFQYAADRLVELHGERSPKLTMTDGKYLEDIQFKQRDVSLVDEMDTVARWFEEKHQVFFSGPLDLDLSMLEQFTSVYIGQAPAGGGPRLPLESDPQYDEVVAARVQQVLGTAEGPKKGATYSQNQKKLFPWYKYLFVDGSKPVAHLRAVALLRGTNWVPRAPPVLQRLVARVTLLSDGDVGA